MSCPNRCAHPASFRKAFFAILFAGTTTLMGGCGIGTVTHATAGTYAFSGHVHGGQQPVANSSVQLYTVGVDGSPSSPMLAPAVSTLNDGSFDITGKYSCASDTDQVYLVATGGNPGLEGDPNNAALVLMTAFGSCGNLPLANFIEINEVTTVAAAWALAPFITSATKIGTTTSNAKGIASAFLNAQMLADSSTGLAATLPSNLTIETAKLYTLADAIAPCVNSTGVVGCAMLFSAATTPDGSIPENTLAAALNIVRKPGQNVSAVFKSINAQAPFSGLLSAAPNDWTMSLTVTGGGLNYPTALGVDGNNNIWVAGETGVLSAFSAQGLPFNSSGYGSGTLAESFGLTIDPNDNIWVSSEQQPQHYPTQGSVTAFLGAGSGTPGALLNNTPYIDDVSIDFPYSIAADFNGDIFIANYANNSVTIYNDRGQFVTSGIASAKGEASLPVAIAADTAHGFWIANSGNDSVVHVSSSGAILANVACCENPQGVAVDSTGNAWISNFYGGSVTELSGNGGIEVDEVTGGGMTNNAPSGIAVDANQTVWTANYYGKNFSQIAGNGQAGAVGTMLSPSTGFGLDAKLSLPFSIAPDAGGNLWISNFGKSSLTMFFGLAAPTKTPLSASPSAP